MELSPGLFEEIIGHRTIRFGDFRRERRRVARAAFPQRTVILPLDGQLGMPVSVKLRELSIRGLSLLHGGRPRIGQRFVARLPRQNADPLWVQCTAARIQPIGQGKHIVGARFDRLLGVLRRPPVY